MDCGDEFIRATTRDTVVCTTIRQVKDPDSRGSPDPFLRMILGYNWGGIGMCRWYARLLMGHGDSYGRPTLVHPVSI